MKGVFEEVWNFDLKDGVSCEPLIISKNKTNEEQIIVATNSGKIISLNSLGKIDWFFDSSQKYSEAESLFLDEETINTINNTPILIKNDEHDEIIFGSENKTIYSIDTQGNLLWSVKTNGVIRGSPLAIKTKEGKIIIVIGSHDGNIYLINDKGKIIKQIVVGVPLETTPLLINNFLTFGSKKGKVIAIDFKGNILWEFETKEKISANITHLKTKDRELLLVASQDNNVYALTLQGEIVWKFSTNGALLSEVKILRHEEDEKIVFGSCDNNVYCITSQGELLWNYETQFWVSSSPEIYIQDEKSFVIAGSFDNNVYVLDGGGSFELDYIPGLSGVVNQSTFQTNSMSKEVGEDQGKKISSFNAKNYITGCKLIPNSENYVIITKKGKVYKLKLK